MDLKALMQKLETINTKQIVTESVETKKVITESVARRVVKESAEPVFKSSIARGLVEEFGYELDEATPPAPVANPYQGADAAKFAAMSPEDQAWLTKGGGKPDINDQFILARAPNKGAPTKRATGAVLDPNGPTSGAAPDAAAPTGTTAQGDDEGNTLITKPDGTTQVVGPDGKPLPNGGRVDPAGGGTKPADAPADAGGSINPATLAQYKALLDKLKASQGSGAATKPAVTPPKKPTQIAPAAKQPAATMPNVDQMGNPTGVPTNEGVTYGDDQILTIIKSVKY